MKLSIRWIYDHIDVNWRTIPLHDLVESFIKTTAEVEQVQSVSCPINTWFIGSVTAILDQTVTLIIAENNTTISLPARPEILIGFHYFIKKDGDTYLWVSMRDVGSAKEGLLPAFYADSQELRGQWRDRFESEDAIITVDNKSINHRPDLWGHRPIAHEIAAKHSLPFISAEKFLKSHEVVKATDANQAMIGSMLVINETDRACSRFAGVSLSNVINRLSDWWVVVRLARAEVKSIDAIVDATNYVMLDWGHPLHAFDADKIEGDRLRVCLAKNQETLTLLDGSTVKLTANDIVIADHKKPISLAGIMGGSECAVSLNSKTLLVEAACFDAAQIRATATRLSKRTESSSRFEKGLNPAIIEEVIKRFLQFLTHRSITHHVQSPIVAIGALPAHKVIAVSHDFIQDQLGVSVQVDTIIAILRSLDFQVEHQQGTYHITVPYSRAKDMAIAQDIVEEVGRMYGYDAIAPIYPTREMKPFSVQRVQRMRAIKRQLSYGLSYKEVMTYAFFDETFLKKIEWEPVKPLQVKEAVSENWRRLVTTLTPNLFNLVQKASEQVPALSVYETARIWPYKDTGTVEQFVLSGVVADFHTALDFYDAKQALNTLFDEIGIKVTWQKIEQPPYPWYMPYQSAWIFHDEKCIGIAGKANPFFYQKVALGDAFIFEVDADFLLAHLPQPYHYKAASKYPRVVRDVSLLISKSLTVDVLLKAISDLDARIVGSVLADFFEKKEWHNEWALTVRITLEDQEKTLQAPDIDLLMKKVTDYLQRQGAQIR